MILPCVSFSASVFQASENPGGCSAYRRWCQESHHLRSSKGGVGSWILQHFAQNRHTSWLKSLLNSPVDGRLYQKIIHQVLVKMENLLCPLSTCISTLFFCCGIHPADGIHRKQWWPQPQPESRRVVEGLESLAISMSHGVGRFN